MILISLSVHVWVCLVLGLGVDLPFLLRVKKKLVADPHGMESGNRVGYWR
jgi:hypothetical protein